MNIIIGFYFVIVAAGFVIGLIFATHLPNGFAISINSDDRLPGGIEQDQCPFEPCILIVSLIGGWNITFSQEAMNRARPPITLSMLDDVSNGAIG